METSRDRVLKAIEHRQPETTPIHLMGPEGIERWLVRFGAKDIMDLREKMDLDIQEVRPVYSGPNTQAGRNIWGSEKDVGAVDGGEGYSAGRGGYPLASATSVADIERFAWPSPEDFDYEVVSRVLSRVSANRARMIRCQYAVAPEGQTREEAARGRGTWLPLLCTLFNLFGFQTTLVNLRLQPAVMEAAIAHLEALTLGFMRRLLDASGGLADIFWYGDDFAMAKGLMLSPEDWRRYLRPTYRKIFQLARSRGLKVWFHCCGTFRPVLPDLIQDGMDVWETVQAHLPGNEPEILKREFGKDIAFYGAVSTQSTLPFGTPDDIRREVRERIRVLGRGGGYICGGDHAILPDVPIENVLAMIQEARSFTW